MNAVYRNVEGEEVVFNRQTLDGEVPVDDSRDATVMPKPEDPLYDVRKDAMSIQFQINQFLTERMKNDAKRPKANE